MHQSFDVTTIVFAVLAVFVLWKLRSVLGTRTGHERPPSNPFERRRADDPESAPGEAGKVIRLPGAAEARPASQAQQAGEAPESWAAHIDPAASAVRTELEAIRAVDPTFAVGPFMAGARAAYEMIVTAFAKGDREALRPLLAGDVFEGFASSIAARDAAGQVVETTFVSLNTALIEDASMRGGTAQITVKFQPQIISVTRDRDGKIVDGSPDEVAEIVDLWTFARDVASNDPNWKLVATETGR